jgi:negative regulator of genetic competence, sporulation and motility
MMDEINEEEDFVVEGPLWIQVHAFEKGVEVTISRLKPRASMSLYVINNLTVVSSTRSILISSHSLQSR